MTDVESVKAGKNMKAVTYVLAIVILVLLIFSIVLAFRIAAVAL